MNPRLLAIRVLQQIIVDGKSLNSCTQQFNEAIDNEQDRGFARELTFGVLRWYPRLLFISQQLLAKPLKAKDQDIMCLLLTGFYQILFMRVPDHAAVSETVKLTQKLKKSWAKSLVNGVLRQLIRERDVIQQKIETDYAAKYAHPPWFIEQLQNDWPDSWRQILEQNNIHAAMVLRVNQQQTTVPDYQKQLAAAGHEATLSNIAPDALILSRPCDVSRLPGFDAGLVSVQDLAAQQAANLLELKPGLRVLDACAAPGGKTAHILEMVPKNEVLALDVNPERIGLVEQTLARLKLLAKLLCADAANTDSWWNRHLFDRILLDAPCSATGVIRRNPDIKIHRTLEDVQQVVHNQNKLLETLWPLLKPGGIFVYATCSVLKQENESQISHFINSHGDAVEHKIESDWGYGQNVGKQILPGECGMDGFYYARIQKLSKDIQ